MRLTPHVRLTPTYLIITYHYHLNGTVFGDILVMYYLFMEVHWKKTTIMYMYSTFASKEGIFVGYQGKGGVVSTEMRKIWRHVKNLSRGYYDLLNQK